MRLPVKQSTLEQQKSVVFVAISCIRLYTYSYTPLGFTKQWPSCFGCVQCPLPFGHISFSRIRYSRYVSLKTLRQCQLVNCSTLLVTVNFSLNTSDSWHSCKHKFNPCPIKLHIVLTGHFLSECDSKFTCGFHGWLCAFQPTYLLTCSPVSTALIDCDSHRCCARSAAFLATVLVATQFKKTLVCATNSSNWKAQ